MKIEKHHLYSDSLKLSSAFFLPDHITKNKTYPLVVICSGFTGLVSMHPMKFAEYFTNKGLLSFSFDYRGFGESEGTKTQLILEEQVRDIRSAVYYARNDLRVDKKKVMLLGWGMGAGLIVQAIQDLNIVSALCAINGFYNGKRFQEFHRGKDGYCAFVENIEKCRLKKVIKNEDTFFEPFEIYLMDPDTTEYVNQYLRSYPRYTQNQFSFEFAESILAWKPEAYAKYMEVPIFIAHGENNKLHSIKEAYLLYQEYEGEKQLYLIKGSGHTEWMHPNDAKFIELCEQIVLWLSKIWS